MHRLTLSAAIAAIALLPGLTAAQVADAAETITQEQVAHHINVIADDSMRGRDTPSRGLEMTARYIGDQFQKLGLKPGGDSGTWYQRYRIPARVNFAQSRIVFTTGGKRVVAGFTTAARLLYSYIPQQPVKGSVLLVSGQRETDSLQRASERGKIILFVGSPASVTGDRMSTLWKGNKGVIVLNNQDSATFAGKLQISLRRPFVSIDSSWTASVRPEAVGGLTELLAAAGVDLANARADTMPTMRDLPAVEVTLEPQFDKPIGDSATRALNTIGIIEGSDPKLKEQYVIFSAHMDHLGIRSGQADSIVNGADDNASGIAGLLELAKAFSQPGARPRRSILFLALSGGAKDFLGSRHFVQGLQNAQAFSQFFGLQGMDQVVSVIANVNLDMIGRKASDSIAVDGLSELKLATPIEWMAAAHAELRLSVIDGGTSFIPESDHFWFTRSGVPSLSFHNGRHGDPPPATDSPSTIDAEQEARILRLVYYVGQSLADTDQRPVWTLEGRRNFLESREP